MLGILYPSSLCTEAVSLNQTQILWVRLVSLPSLLWDPLSSSEARIPGRPLCPPSIDVDSGDLDSGPDTFRASTVAVEPLSQLIEG